MFYLRLSNLKRRLCNFLTCTVEFPKYVSALGKQKFTDIFSTKNYFQPLPATAYDHHQNHEQVDNPIVERLIK